MKKLFIVFIVFFQVSLAQNAFETANQLYQKGNYNAAITNYESILASGKQSAELYFNLANCYYKLHKVAPAIYNYEKALQLNPNDDEIQTNLEFAQKKIVNNIKEIPQVGFSKLIQNFTSAFHYNTWAYISVFLAFVFLAFFVGYYFSKTAAHKRLFFTGMIVVFLVILMSISAGFSQKNKLENENFAIIFAEITQLKTEPRKSSSSKTELHEGVKVVVLESIANWKKVQLADETTGWIEENAIKELN